VLGIPAVVFLIKGLMEEKGTMATIAAAFVVAAIIVHERLLKKNAQELEDLIDHDHPWVCLEQAEYYEEKKQKQEPIVFELDGAL